MEVDGIAMVRLLGPQDRLLSQIEKQFPLIEVLVRGNEITLVGEPAQVQAAERLIEELLQMVRNGQDLGPVDVASSASTCGASRGPCCVLRRRSRQTRVHSNARTRSSCSGSSRPQRASPRYRRKPEPTSQNARTRSRKR